MDPLAQRFFNLYDVYTNDARDPNKSFRIEITLWVYGKKVQAMALIDSSASISVINKSLVYDEKLVTSQLTSPIEIRNADGTENSIGSIKQGVKAYIEHDYHKSTEFLYVMDIENIDVILGYDWILSHNPEFNWPEGTMKYRCTESCTQKKKKGAYVSEEGAEPFSESIHQIIADFPIDFLGEEDLETPFISWLENLDTEEEYLLQEIVRTITAKDDGELIDEDDLQKWKLLVPETYEEFGPTVFSQRASERMPERKPYDHGIEFNPEKALPPPAHPYKMSPAEENSLDQWIQEELRKGYIQHSKSPIASPVFFIPKKDGGL